MEFKIEQSNNYFELFKSGDNQKILNGNWSISFGIYEAEILNQKEKLIYSINRKFSFWKLKMSYSINDNFGNIIELKATNKRHSIYEMKIEKNEYVLKLHKGRKKSVYKNGIQIAKIDESLIQLFCKEKIKIITNNQENINEIFLLILCLKIGEENDDGITFDFGNIGKMEPIDNNWNPEKQSTNYNTS